ncbi:MAG: rRNA pseudouridine synthase [Planctomycetota bacterium]|nr:rRNA pseudouridine synthase [Planctomycetota bacterium]
MSVPPATSDRRHRSTSDARPADTDSQRLQKVLAAAGVASRRECEQLILEGRVEVDRQVVTRLGTKVDVASQEIRLDGEVVPQLRRAYYLVHKPKGYVSTSQDPAGRPRVVDLVPEAAGRLFTVGRLDMDSEGLMLLTNDGELANRLAHPRFGVEKRYEVQVAGYPEPEVLRKLRKGVVLADGVVRAQAARVKRRHKQSSVLEIVLKEGKNREIRRMLAAQGHKVQRLRRVALGSLRLGQLPVGEYRELTRGELKQLRTAAAPRPQGSGKQGAAKNRRRGSSRATRRASRRAKP